jgi:hypothetical protein
MRARSIASSGTDTQQRRGSDRVSYSTCYLAGYVAAMALLIALLVLSS